MPRLLEALDAAGVRFVVTGSVALAAWTGVAERPPGDLDIAPELSAENLATLAALLERMRARPVHRPEWKRTLSPDECAAWRPEPATEAQLDHQVATVWGLFDVVPRVSGEYAALAPRAALATVWGVRARIAHPDDLLATLRPDRREEHRARAVTLRALSARVAAGAGPAGLPATEAG